jgi:hypothetical protein
MVHGNDNHNTAWDDDRMEAFITGTTSWAHPSLKGLRYEDIEFIPWDHKPESNPGAMMAATLGIFIGYLVTAVVMVIAGVIAYSMGWVH